MKTVYKPVIKRKTYSFVVFEKEQESTQCITWLKEDIEKDCNQELVKRREKEVDGTTFVFLIKECNYDGLITHLPLTKADKTVTYPAKWTYGGWLEICNDNSCTNYLYNSKWVPYGMESLEAVEKWIDEVFPTAIDKDEDD